MSDFHSHAKGNVNGEREGWEATRCWRHRVKRICMPGCFIYPHQFSVKIRLCNSVNCTMNIHARLSVFRIRRTISIFSHNVALPDVCLYNFALLCIKINKWIYYKIGNMGRVMWALQRGCNLVNDQNHPESHSK